MKKFLALLLALSVVLAAAACGNVANNTDSENTSGATGTTAELPETTAATEATEEPTEPTTEPATEPTNEPSAEIVTDGAFPVGTSDGNTYTNAFIGIRCTLDEKWDLMTAEEVRAQNEEALLLDYETLLTTATALYDMMADHVNQEDNMAILLEKLSDANANLTEEQYLARYKDSVISGLMNMGFEILSADVTTTLFAGEEHAVLNLSCDYTGTAMYQTLVAVKRDNYIACITVCTWDENTSMDVLNQFVAY